MGSAESPSPEGVESPAGERYLTLSDDARAEMWRRAVAAVEDYLQNVGTRPLLPDVDVGLLRTRLHAWGLDHPHAPQEALDFVLEGMTEGQLHTAHPCYYGVFNPRAATAGIVGDMLASGFNTQLASFTSAPFAIEVEQYLVTEFGHRFGYEHCEGVFTSGGTEANHTALLCALEHQFPGSAATGLRPLPGLPVLYVSSETHHSFLKAARMAGLGAGAVREIATDPRCRMDVDALRRQIQEDQAAGLLPFMVVATLGSTAGGVVDAVSAMADVAQAEGLWLHLDAAWGGAAIVLPELSDLFRGAGRSDSFTLDAHKWFSVPMTAGLYVTRRGGSLERTFRVDGTSYMPAESATSARFQPYAQSMAWSRRFLGLKLFLALSLAGWEGYAAVLRHQVAMGRLLRSRLEASQWQVLNDTPLPVVCFVDGQGPMDVEVFAQAVAQTGKTWITTTHLGSTPTLRAGIANYATQPVDVQTLVDVLNAVREASHHPGL